MLYGLLITFFVFLCFFIVILVLLQKSKGSLGMGSLGGNAQMLFGATGGQDLFQKVTWICGALFIGGSLLLAIMRSSHLQSSRYFVPKTTIPVHALPTTPSQEA